MSQLDQRGDQAVLESPVFIVGSLRSGSTLLRLLMDHHPQVNMFGEFEGAVSEANEEHWPKLEEFWRFVKTDRQTSALGLEIDRSLDYESLIRDFLAQLHQRNPAAVIGASIHSRVDLLPRIWPSARYIQLMRDPRDVARSCIGMGWVGNVYEGAKVWSALEARRKKLRSRIDRSQSIDVHYEQLVSDPTNELKRICNFLNISYDPQMLEIARDTTYSFPSAKYANQWRKKLSENEIRWVELQTAARQSLQGYEQHSQTHKPLTFSEKVRIILQNRLYRALFHIKKWGISLWIQHVISRRLGYKKWVDRVRLSINEKDKLYLK